MGTSRTLIIAVAVAVSVAGCTSTRQAADLAYHAPSGPYTLLVMKPNVSVGLVTTGGLFERRADWTNGARANIATALRDGQGAHGGKTIFYDAESLPAEQRATLDDVERLNGAVTQAIVVHRFLPGSHLPSKKGKFDWTLGDEAAARARALGGDYALFVNVKDSFTSGGRRALQIFAAMGGVAVQGGEQSANASLVDLKTGQVVWFNTLASSVGDVRKPEGAKEMVDHLLKKMPTPSPMLVGNPAAGSDRANASR
jgi:hypothetical protein